MKQSLKENPVDALIKFARYGVAILILALTIASLFHYTGHLYVYLIFSVVSNALLYFGFRKNSIFFDTFIGIFFWLGFWLKLTIRVCFADGAFHEAVGDFDGTGAAFDHALWVTTCGMLGLIAASFVRERFIFQYASKSDEFSQKGILAFYQANRNPILISYVVLFLIVALTNIYLGIYQRGAITQTTLPFGLNGIYKWLLLFGLASFSAVILRCELLIKEKASYLVVILSLSESFLTNVSMLSRGMILNVSALAYGMYKSMKKASVKITPRLLVTFFLTFSILFASSVVMVNYIRTNGPNFFREGMNEGVNEGVSQAAPLFIDRWVGIEGVMAVASNPKSGWNLWQEAWKERYSENTMSFFDKNLITSPYNQTDFTKKHYISLPGIMAFFFYPGSLAFLFGSMFLLGLLAALIEMSAYKLGGNNLILCALIGEVVAYRFASFGYVPAQSYLLFGTIFLNLIIIYFADRLLDIWNERRQKHENGF